MSFFTAIDEMVFDATTDLLKETIKDQACQLKESEQRMNSLQTGHKAEIQKLLLKNERDIEKISAGNSKISENTKAEKEVCEKHQLVSRQLKMEIDKREKQFENEKQTLLKLLGDKSEAIVKLQTELSLKGEIMKLQNYEMAGKDKIIKEFRRKYENKRSELDDTRLEIWISQQSAQANDKDLKELLTQLQAKITASCEVALETEMENQSLQEKIAQVTNQMSEFISEFADFQALCVQLSETVNVLIFFRELLNFCVFLIFQITEMTDAATATRLLLQQKVKLINLLESQKQEIGDKAYQLRQQIANKEYFNKISSLENLRQLKERDEIISELRKHLQDNAREVRQRGNELNEILRNLV